MKNILVLLSLVWVSGIYAQTLTDSLKGFYTFNENLNDYSGNDNHIVTGSGTYTSDRFGNPFGALSLNGINDSLVFPIQEFAPITGDFSISFWYRSNEPEIMNLFSSKQNTEDTISNFEIQLSSHNKYYLEYYTQTFYQAFVYWNGTGGSDNAIGEGMAGQYTKGKWCHFVITRSADSFNIYFDHQLHALGLDAHFSGILGNLEKMIFSASPHFFKGSIDDLRMYNRALSQYEIDRLWFENDPFIMVQPKSDEAYVQGSNLLVYWEYDETAIGDSILVEYSINNGPWIASEHTNMAYEYYTYIDMTYPPGTSVEVRVSDYSDTLKNKSTGQFFVSEYDWVEVQDSLPFNPKDGAGLLNFKNKMWLLGGWDPPYHEPNYTHSEVWSSTNGEIWNYEYDAPWPGRHCVAWISSDSAMWVIGGDPQSGCLTDVWKSTDGIEWTQILDEIPDYSKRIMPNYAYFNDHLFLYGGQVCSGDPLSEVWQSEDGYVWAQLPDAPWLGRGMQISSCVDGSGQLWMLGGSNETTRRCYNEVWKTADGINWELVSASAPWAGRFWHTVAYFDNKIWLMGGITTGLEMNDVWYSEDGINWFELKSTTGNWPAGSRHAHSTVVYDDALWYMCGVGTNNVWKIVNTESPTDIPVTTQINSPIRVFPNPNTGDLQFECTEENINSDFTILNIYGEIQYTAKIKTTNLMVDIHFLPAGIYFLRIHQPKEQIVKIIKL